MALRPWDVSKRLHEKKRKRLKKETKKSDSTQSVLVARLGSLLSSLPWSPNPSRTRESGNTEKVTQSPDSNETNGYFINLFTLKSDIFISYRREFSLNVIRPYVLNHITFYTTLFRKFLHRATTISLVAKEQEYLYLVCFETLPIFYLKNILIIQN